MNHSPLCKAWYFVSTLELGCHLQSEDLVEISSQHFILQLYLEEVSNRSTRPQYWTRMYGRNDSLPQFLIDGWVDVMMKLLHLLMGESKDRLWGGGDLVSFILSKLEQ